MVEIDRRRRRLLFFLVLLFAGGPASFSKNDSLVDACGACANEEPPLQNLVLVIVFIIFVGVWILSC